MSAIELENPGHDDFEVISRDDKFGGFEILRHKDKRMTKHVLADEPFGTVYPVYTHDDRKWVVMSFTYTKGNQKITKILLWKDRKSSREALGIWKVDGQAWKVYQTTKEYDKLFADYQRAGIHAGLPMGRYSFTKGKVKKSNKTTDGFVLATEWMEGTNFQKSASSFEAALKREKISQDKNSTDYKRTKAGCDAANKVGLRDPQGFVKAGIFEPLRFIDVHTSWNDRKNDFDHSGEAQALVDKIDAWAKE
ncbi:hypothetical protein F5I97DRAFT_1939215 [Phlebopus sp. FC_14]|nr:hypothetical protein F5I97DRAFT_1939215 [Phlebopus sp. FC_14]